MLSHWASILRGWGRSHSVAYQPQEEHLDDLLWLRAHTRHRWLRPYRDYLTDIPYLLRRTFMLNYLQVILIWNASRGCSKQDGCAISPTFYRLGTTLTWIPNHARGASLKKSCTRTRRNLSLAPRSAPHEVLFTDKDAALLRGCSAGCSTSCLTREITIEANPTSNLLIAELGALDKHPMFQIRSASGANRPSRRPRIALVTMIH